VSLDVIRYNNNSKGAVRREQAKKERKKEREKCDA